MNFLNDNIVFVANTKFTCETQWIDITHRNNVIFFLIFQTTYASMSWIKMVLLILVTLQFSSMKRFHILHPLGSM